jgi:hypothetical protein
LNLCPHAVKANNSKGNVDEFVQQIDVKNIQIKAMTKNIDELQLKNFGLLKENSDLGEKVFKLSNQPQTVNTHSK